jgi:hypothetical protein
MTKSAIRASACGIAFLASRERETNRASQPAHGHVDLSTQAPAGTVKGLILSPIFAPAACWWARMIVDRRSGTQSRDNPTSPRRCATRSRIPMAAAAAPLWRRRRRQPLPVPRLCSRLFGKASEVTGVFVLWASRARIPSILDGIFLNNSRPSRMPRLCSKAACAPLFEGNALTSWERLQQGDTARFRSLRRPHT